MELEASCGDKKKVYEFVKNIKEKDKIALISHNDIDGIASAKIICQLIIPQSLRFINYNQLDSLLIEELKKEQANKIILTDLGTSEQSYFDKLEKFSEILIIDHHQIKKDLNTKHTFYFNCQGYAAAYINYSLFEDNPKVKELDWLVALASVSDWQYFKNKEWIEKTYKKYGDSFDIKNPRKGKLWDLTEKLTFALIYFQENLGKVYSLLDYSIDSIKKLDPYAEKVKKELEFHLNNFEKQKEEIKEGWFYVINSKYSIEPEIATFASLKDFDKMVLVTREEKGRFFVSARRQDRKFNVAKFLEEATIGFQDSSAGGHLPSAGCNFPKKYLKEFIKRIKEMPIEEFRVS